MKAFHTITRRLSVAPRRAVDPTHTESSLAAFGSGALLARASLMSALRLPGFVPCAKFALAFGANGARSANPAYNLAGRGVLAVAQRLVEPRDVAGREPAVGHHLLQDLGEARPLVLGRPAARREVDDRRRRARGQRRARAALRVGHGPGGPRPVSAAGAMAWCTVWAKSFSPFRCGRFRPWRSP